MNKFKLFLFSFIIISIKDILIYSKENKGMHTISALFKTKIVW